MLDIFSHKTSIWHKKPKIIRIFGKKIFHLYGTPDALRVDDSFFDISSTPRTWGNWHRKIKALCPFQFWFREQFIFKVKYWMFFYWQHRYYNFITWWHDYSVLKMPTVKRGDYLDPSDQLKHAAFAVFLKYMDKAVDRHCHDLGEWDNNKESFPNKEEFDKFNNELKQRWEDCLDIKNYILKERVEREKTAESFLMSRLFDDYRKSEEDNKKREEEILMKIIKMRDNLWT